MNNRSILSVAIALLPFGAQAQAFGEETISFRVGASQSRADTTGRADSRLGTGSTVDFEGDLGLAEKKTTPLVDLSLRFAPRHQLQLDYYKVDRSASSVLRGSINWHDQVFNVNTRVSGKFDSEIYSLTYLYSLLKGPDAEVAFGIGIHNTKFTAGIASDAGNVSVSDSANAPLPVVAGQATFRLGDHLRAELRAKWLGIKIGDYDGRVVMGQATLQWFPVKHVGIGAGYILNRYDLDISKANWTGALRYRFNGPTAFVVAQF